MKVLFLGSTDFSVPFLEEIYKSRHSISLVVTTPDKKRGRGKKMLPNAVKERCLDLRIRVLEAEKLDEKFLKEVKSANFDCMVVVSFGLILPKRALNLTPDKCINFHPSLLPKYRGPSPIISTLINGDKEGGFSIMKITEKVDAGDIYVQTKMGISDDDNRETLEKKLTILGSPILISILNLMEKENLKAFPQDDNLATYTSILTKEDLKINWDKKSTEIVNKVRAFAPSPGCFTIYRGKRIKIMKVALFENGKEDKFKSVGSYLAGEIVAADRENGLLVKCCTDNILKIIQLKPEGKKLMEAIDFINGYRPQPGDRFE